MILLSLQPPVLAGKRSRTNLIEVRGDISYCLFLSQSPQKNLPSHVAPQAESLITPSRQFFRRFTLSRRNTFPITFTYKISQYKYLFQRSDMHHHYSFSLMKFEHKYCCKTHSQTWCPKKLVPHYVATVMDMQLQRSRIEHSFIGQASSLEFEISHESICRAVATILSTTT